MKPQPPEDLWESISGLEPIEDRQPGDMTLVEFGDRYKMSYTTAQSRLNRLIEEGRVIKVRARGKFRMQSFYRPVKR